MPTGNDASSAWSGRSGHGPVERRHVAPRPRRQHPADYLRHSYYENWLAGLEKLLVEKGLVTTDELISGQAAGPADEQLRTRRLKAAAVATALAGAHGRAQRRPASFQPGDRVHAVNRHPVGHTREPRYVRGRCGVIHEDHRAHFFPDLSAEGVAWPVISIRSASRRKNCGAQTPTGARVAVYVDLWEDYLEPA